jgi:hypothetical protein
MISGDVFSSTPLPFMVIINGPGGHRRRRQLAAEDPGDPEALHLASAKLLFSFEASH